MKHLKILNEIHPLTIFLLLTLLTLSIQVSAYDAPWNGGREDITGTSQTEQDEDCSGSDCQIPEEPDCRSTSSPVYTAKGYLVWQEQDIDLSGIRLGLKRTYNSFDRRAGLFGRGWVTVQESSIARTYKALKDAANNDSQAVTDQYTSVPIWLSESGRRYQLEETDTGCNTPAVLFFTFEKQADGGFKQVYEDSNNYQIYSVSGLLKQSYSESHGTSIYYEYDNEQRLVNQFDSQDNTLRFQYNENGFVSQVSDNAGREWHYQYNDQGNLIKQIDPEGHSRDYAYQTIDNTGFKQYLLTDISSNENLSLLNVTWSNIILYKKEAMRVQSYTEQDGIRHEYSYKAVSYQGKESVEVTKTSRQPGSNHIIRQLRITADSDSYLIAKVENLTQGTIEEKQYNAASKITRINDVRGNITRLEYDDAGHVTQKTELADTVNERNILISYLDQTDKVASLRQYDQLEVRYTYDNKRRLLTRTERDLASGIERQWSYSYHGNTTDSHGNQQLGKLASIDGPQDGNGDRYAFNYNNAGQLIKLTNPLGQQTILAYNSAGQLSHITDAHGIVTQLDYDSHNRLLSSTTDQITQAYTYNAQGQLTQLIDEQNRETRLEYNQYGQLSRISYPSGDTLEKEYEYNAGETRVTTRYIQEDGTLIKTAHESYDPQSGQTVSTYLSALSEQSSAQRYNALHELEQNTLYGQFGNTTDTSASQTDYQYDSEGALSSIIDALSGTTTMNYDDFKRLVQLTDANGAQTQYQYNALNDLLSVNSQDTGNTSYQYDNAGNLKKRTLSNGNQADYQYDALNRTKQITYSDTQLNATLTYDEGSYGKGLLTSISDGSGNSSYQYDKQGRVQQQSSQVNGRTFITAYIYNDSNQITTVTYPSGLQLSYDYNNDTGRLMTISRTDTGHTGQLFEVTRWHGSHPGSYQYGNAFKTQFEYDNNGKLTNTQFDSVNNKQHTILDRQGNLVQQDWSRDGTTESRDYRYDMLGHLSHDGITSNDWSYQYDTLGNRREQSQQTSGTIELSYEDSSNRLEKKGADSIALDSSGNTLDDGTRQYQYNAMNRLGQLSHTANGITAHYTYNYLGQRVVKTVSGALSSLTLFVYGQAGELLGEYDSNGVPIREYLYITPGISAAELLAQLEGNGEIVYIHTDHLGTPRLVTNQMKTIVWRWVSDAFGNGVAQADPDSDGNDVVINHRFAGQYFDNESGLHYNYHRYYDPSLGRYITSDPIGLEGGLNTYTYVGGNPLKFTDPLGLKKINLGQGHSGRIDSFEYDGKSSFEIHVYDKKGREVGVYGPDGWINKHGHSGGPKNLPSEVENRCKGVAVDEMRKRNELPDRGKKNIKGNNWMRKMLNKRNPFAPSPTRLPPGHPLEDYM